MRCHILHRGVPIGTTELVASELSVGELRPGPGYDSIRQTVLLASQSLWGTGFFGAPSSAVALPLDVIRRAAELELELRDERGDHIPADFVNVVERPSGDLPVVFARFRLDPAAQSAPFTPTSPSTSDVRSSDR